MSEQTQYQDARWVIEEAVRFLQKNQRRRVSAMFRDLRKKPYLSLFGDYVILSGIALAYRELSLPMVREHFIYAIKFSKEMSKLEKGVKTNLLNQLGLLSKK